MQLEFPKYIDFLDIMTLLILLGFTFNLVTSSPAEFKSEKLTITYIQAIENIL